MYLLLYAGTTFYYVIIYTQTIRKSNFMQFGSHFGATMNNFDAVVPEWDANVYLLSIEYRWELSCISSMHTYVVQNGSTEQ